MKFVALSVILALAVSLSSAVPVDQLLIEEWETFKATHGKVYLGSEEEFRMNIFLDNRQKIAEHNARYHKGEVTFTLAMNRFGDMLSHEFVSQMNGYKGRTSALKGATFMKPANVQVPESVDWRQSGYVTPVKDQAQCGSCWAFSATGAMEGQHFRKTGKLVSLSEQNLVDCSDENGGCNGGLMDLAFDYVKQNGGIDTESSYPYEGRDRTCRFNKDNVGATVSGFVDVESEDEDALKAALATVGPVSVAIDASNYSFQFYEDGIYNEPRCSSFSLDHGVLAVGYGTDAAGDYWLIKNSWGKYWGSDGYIKIARGSNLCGVATEASYPTV